MTIQFTLTSRHQPLLALVREFAQGLGYDVETSAPAQVIHFQVRDGAEMLLHVLTDVALGATRLGVGLDDAVCQVRYREPRATAEVTLNLRLSDIGLHNTAGSGAAPA
jgi:hypothetical protein